MALWALPDECEALVPNGSAGGLGNELWIGLEFYLHYSDDGKEKKGKGVGERANTQAGIFWPLLNALTTHMGTVHGYFGNNLS